MCLFVCFQCLCSHFTNVSNFPKLEVVGRKLKSGQKVEHKI